MNKRCSHLSIPLRVFAGRAADQDPRGRAAFNSLTGIWVEGCGARGAHDQGRLSIPLRVFDSLPLLLALLGLAVFQFPYGYLEWSMCPGRPGILPFQFPYGYLAGLVQDFVVAFQFTFNSLTGIWHLRSPDADAPEHHLSIPLRVFATIAEKILYYYYLELSIPLRVFA